MSHCKHPVIIQGGMGIGVSTWRLANAVARTGQLGVVSGTVIDQVVVRRLQDGDPGGHMRRAIEHFPVREIAERVLDTFYIPGGKPADKPYITLPMLTLEPRRERQELLVVTSFAEVWLAREGHDGPVGMNLLEKIQIPNLFCLYGAMLAGVDKILMGAGIPREIPGALDRLARHEPAWLRVHVEGAARDSIYRTGIDPRAIVPLDLPPLKRPDFLAIISSVTLAQSLIKKSTGKVDGFIVEGPVAGGHNAPPRGAAQFNERGEPLYGPRDEVDLERIGALGLPYWVAGQCDDPAAIKALRARGAAGVQVGTLFALCEESGFAPEVRAEAIRMAMEGRADVFTDPKASPTGFPFKIARLDATLSENDVYAARPRICDLGYLRHPYAREDGSVGFRCPAEPVDQYVKKGGDATDTEQRKCLCNSLLANVGQSQVHRAGYVEPPLVTLGDGYGRIVRLLKDGSTRYHAADVIRYLLGEGSEREKAAAGAAADHPVS